MHPHRFRHDTARRLVETIDLPTVAAWLGHERLDTVRIYSQPDDAALERAAAHQTDDLRQEQALPDGLADWRFGRRIRAIVDSALRCQT